VKKRGSSRRVRRREEKGSRVFERLFGGEKSSKNPKRRKEKNTRGKELKQFGRRLVTQSQTEGRNIRQVDKPGGEKSGGGFVVWAEKPKAREKKLDAKT